MDTERNDAQPIDLTRFELTACDRVTIAMPEMPEVCEDDIDAQLFAYVASAPKGSPVKSIADLDDAWVRENLPLYEGIGEVRNAIRANLTKETAAAFDELKYAKCADALVGRLRGDLPAEAVAEMAEAVRARNEDMLRQQGLTVRRYLEDHRMSESDYDAKVREEAERELALNVALDKMVEATATTVANGEITEYLACDDPESFLEEVRESGRIEDARRAASRVKVMRRVIETAKVGTAAESEA